MNLYQAYDELRNAIKDIQKLIDETEGEQKEINLNRDQLDTLITEVYGIIEYTLDATPEF